MKSRVVAAFLVAGMSGSVMGDELWRQNPVDSFGGLAAQDARNAGGLGWFAEVVDDFDAQAGWTISAVEFWGGYAQVAPGNTHGFMIRFYSDSGGQVGSLELTQDVMTFSEVVYYTYPGLNYPGYHYSLTLGTPFVVPSAGKYWMSVTAILDRGGTANEPQWGWIQATTLTGLPCKQRFFSPNFNAQNQDVSFVLTGTTGGATCYANCDASSIAPILNVNDFTCFLNKFAAGDSYANCDASTNAPTLNVNDFTCFLNKFAAGCP